MHRALLIRLLCRHSVPCELKCLERSYFCCYCRQQRKAVLRMNISSTITILITTICPKKNLIITTTTEKTYKHLSLYFPPPLLFPCSGFVATESIYFRWSLLDLQTAGRMAPVNTSVSNRIAPKQNSGACRPQDQLTHAIHASMIYPSGWFHGQAPTVSF